MGRLFPYISTLVGSTNLLVAAAWLGKKCGRGTSAQERGVIIRCYPSSESHLPATITSTASLLSWRIGMRPNDALSAPNSVLVRFGKLSNFYKAPSPPLGLENRLSPYSVDESWLLPWRSGATPRHTGKPAWHAARPNVGACIVATGLTAKGKVVPSSRRYPPAQLPCHRFWISGFLAFSLTQGLNR